MEAVLITLLEEQGLDASGPVSAHYDDLQGLAVYEWASSTPISHLTIERLEADAFLASALSGSNERRLVSLLVARSADSGLLVATVQADIDSFSRRTLQAELS